jgi:hypothetical protein
MKRTNDEETRTWEENDFCLDNAPSDIIYRIFLDLRLLDFHVLRLVSKKMHDACHRFVFAREKNICSKANARTSSVSRETSTIFADGEVGNTYACVSRSIDEKDCKRQPELELELFLRLQTKADLLFACITQNYVSLFEWIFLNDPRIMSYKQQFKHGEVDAILDSFDFCTSCALEGTLEMLKKCKEFGFNWDKKVPVIAARQKNIPMLKWSIENGCPWGDYVIEATARYCDLETLQWLLKLDTFGSSDEDKRKHVISSFKICEVAVIGGQVDILNWVVKQKLLFIHEDHAHFNAYTGEWEKAIIRFMPNEKYYDFTDPESSRMLIGHAAKWGKVEVLDWAVEKMKWSWKLYDVFCRGAINDQPGVMEWCKNHVRTCENWEKIWERLQDREKEEEHDDIFKFRKWCGVYKKGIVENILMHDCVASLKWFEDNGFDYNDLKRYFIPCIVFKNNSFRIVEYLKEKKISCCSIEKHW